MTPMKTFDLKATLGLRLYALSKIPLLHFVRPRILQIDETECHVAIPLKRRNQNHLKSMYFGTLCIGADLAGGLLAMEKIKQSGKRISLVFKSVKADFLKRVDGDAVFTCRNGQQIDQLIQTVVDTGERHHTTLNINVTSPQLYGEEVLAEFELELSLKEKVNQ